MKKRHSGPQIVAKLRQSDVLIDQGKSVPELCREIEVSEQTVVHAGTIISGGSGRAETKSERLQKGV